jgi:hypothetical protein
MRGETIARALVGLGSDPEMWQRLIELRVALDDVLESDGVPCKHCGAVARCFAIGSIPLLADRLAAVVRGTQTRDHRGEDARRRSLGKNWQRRRPDIRKGASRHGREGGAR